MKESKKKSAGRPRSVQSHRAMLQATLELLGEVGFNGISMEAISSRAGIGKTTIYRRYSSKAELVADAIESLREEVLIPDTGSLWGDLDAIIDNAAKITLTPLGRQTVAMIMSSAAGHAEFAQIYWTKYLQPRRQAFVVVVERAKARKEVQTDLEPGLVFDAMSGIMLYTLLFPPSSESWNDYVRRSIKLMIGAGARPD
uniref:Transcriptional regulator, TetR family n=1 Tax=Cyanothece sp. (strain PCC 7425 / ATCC 29141) TaxID=395961 RepID=B8HYK4_CYAP4